MILSRVTLAKICFLAGILNVTALLSAQAHAFLDVAEPAVGSSAKRLPTEVKIRFTQELDPAASSIKVFDAAGKEVDGQNVHVDPKDNRVLIVSLPATISAGTYKVVWRATSRDTHVTQGDFTITKEP